MFMIHNFTYWQQNLMSQIMYGYNITLGFFVWPILFTAVIGYIYLKQQSYVAAAVATMVIMAAFSNYMSGMETWVSVMFILVALSITGLVLIFISKRRT